MSAAPDQPLNPALASEWRPRYNPWLIATAVMAATFMEVLDTTVVTVSLPHIAGSLSVTPEEATWVLTSYLVANAIILPASGWLSSVFGRKRFLIACIVIFTIASGLCGVANSLGMLIVARILQGAGGGALQPISQAVLLESFPPHRRGVAMAVFGLGVVTAPIIGPTLGGWMTDNYSWRWVFYINLPVGIAAVLMAQILIEDPPYIRRRKGGRIDLIGFALLILWVGCLQVLLDKGQQEDWLASQFIRWLAALSAGGVVAFVIWELRAAEPLVDLRILSNRNFTTGTALMTMVGAVLYACTALLPLYLQTLLGYSAFESGLTTSPRGFGSIVAILLVGRLIGLIDGRMLILIGFVLLGVSTRMLGNLSLEIIPQNVVWPNIINGFSTGLIFVPLTTLTMGTLKNEQMGNATGIFNLMRNLGGGIGIATVTTFLARGAQTHQAIMSSHLTPYDSQATDRLRLLTGTLTPHSNPVTAAAQAMHILYGQLLQQANLWAYVDNFRLLAFASFCCVPAVFLMRRTRRPGPVAVH